jgi:hypothetical protein
MSVPVEDCEPLIGPSTAIVPAVGDAVVELDDEQLEAPTAVTASATTTAATRIWLILRFKPPPYAPSHRVSRRQRCRVFDRDPLLPSERPVDQEPQMP